MLLLNLFGDLERILSEDLYPYRVPLTVAGIAVLAGLAVLAYRVGVHRLLLRHRVITAAVGTPLLVVTLLVGNYLLSPLWERSHLVEESPLAVMTEAEPGVDGEIVMMDTTDTEFAPTVTRRGEFMGADDFHFGRGDALLIETEPGKYVIRFENFSVRNGPDLYVYLSREIDSERVDEMLNLGRLKATDGAFNYEVPAELDLSNVKSVIVWCRQFSTLFAEAPLL